jgi:hypothetical protein
MAAACPLAAAPESYRLGALAVPGALSVLLPPERRPVQLWLKVDETVFCYG